MSASGSWTARFPFGHGCQSPLSGEEIRADEGLRLAARQGAYYRGLSAQCKDQMTSFIADIDRAKLGSPDRVDALVWGLTELMVERMPYEGLYNYYRERAAEVALASEASQ